jgi:integral membrane protein
VALLETPSGLPPKSVSALRRLRLISTPEAVSFLVLLVCSVLKRTSDFDAVPVMGPIHGVLFIGYVLFWADAWNKVKWPRKHAWWLFALSVLPTGGFFADRLLAREEETGVVAARARQETAGGDSGGSGGADDNRVGS